VIHVQRNGYSRDGFFRENGPVCTLNGDKFDYLARFEHFADISFSAPATIMGKTQGSLRGLAAPFAR
jgi:hypothetical protein